SLRLRAILFGVYFVIYVGVQAAEAVVALIVRDVAAHGIRAHVLQKHDTGGHRRLGLVADDPMHRAQLCLMLRVLGTDADHRGEQKCWKSEHSRSSGHDLPPSGSMRKTKFPSLLSFALIGRLWSA